MLKVLTEASGGLTSGFIIKSIRNAGFQAVASDINEWAAGRFLADDFIKMPSARDPELWEKTVQLLEQHQVNVVFPSLDETLLGWSKIKDELKKSKNIHVIVSEPDTVRVCQDKWETYKFFLTHGIPTPDTSLEQKYPLIKPRFGRGSKGILVTNDPVPMDNMISQEIVQGEEYTIDILCDKESNPIYIVPRRRWHVRDGKSTGGIVVYHEEMIEWVKRICRLIRFVGPVNIQCFVCPDGSIRFIEINPRLAGGMALGFAATENWIEAMVHHVVYGRTIIPKNIKYGLKMLRYYDEIFIP